MALTFFRIKIRFIWPNFVAKLAKYMKFINLLILAIAISACGKTTAISNSESGDKKKPDTEKTWPAFNADSAYQYVADQVSIGPRVPGTTAHIRCRDYIVTKMTSFGADTVYLQSAEVTAFNGNKLPMHNIIARFNTKSPTRILIAAHYDTRPWADEDPVEANRNKAIDGANDGASGVGVALEIARNLSLSLPTIGVDFLMTDVEDYGSSTDETSEQISWALGAQYFANNNPYDLIERPIYGILLDMVGGKSARFYREYFSEQAASLINAKVWQAARSEGISRFVNETRGAITDDHLFINQAGIPCIDIIACSHPETGSFAPTWHTMADNLESIDKATLEDVGRTVMRVIYTEKAE